MCGTPMTCAAAEARAADGESGRPSNFRGTLARPAWRTAWSKDSKRSFAACTSASEVSSPER